MVGIEWVERAEVIFGFSFEVFLGGHEDGRRFLVHVIISRTSQEAAGDYEFVRLT